MMQQVSKARTGSGSHATAASVSLNNQKFSVGRVETEENEIILTE
jgi:hypothetical protein